MSFGRQQVRYSAAAAVVALMLGLAPALACGVRRSSVGATATATPPATARPSPQTATATVEPEPTVPVETEEAPSPVPTEGQRARIEIDVAQRMGPVNELLFGSQVIAAGGGNGILDPDRRFSGEALEMIGDLKPSVLRFGGQPIFEDGIGPLQSRPPARCGWEDWRTHEYGIDEHMALLRAIGAEGQALIWVGYPYALARTGDSHSCIVPSSEGNLGQRVRRAMAWVAYMNADPSDTTRIGVDEQGFDWGTAGDWAQRRADNGHPEPYGVRYWDLGIEGRYYDEDTSPEEYGRDYILFREAMKRVDPRIVLGASAMLSPRGDSVWNIPLLSVIGPYVDALVVHAYYPGVAYDRSLRSAAVAAATQADRDLTRLRRLLATETGRADEIGLILGGVGISYDYDYEASQPDIWNTLLVGLYDADLMGVLVGRSADYGLELGVQHWLHGAAPTCAIHFDWSTRERFKRPSYYALQMWTNHFGDVLVEDSVACDAFDFLEAYGNVGPLYRLPYLAAHTSIAGDRLYLLVINRHLSEDVQAAIHIEGFIPVSRASVHTLNAADVESANEDGDHDAVVITASEISDASPDFCFVFPAHSVTAIELQQVAGEGR